MKYQLKKEDWDNQQECMLEAKRLGFTDRIGYHAWVAGQCASGYESVLAFFDDIEKLKRHLSTFPTEKRHNNDFKKVCPHKNTEFDFNNNKKCKDCGTYEWDWGKPIPKS